MPNPKLDYEGKHWTQKPENKARLKKMLKKAHARRRKLEKQRKFKTELVQTRDRKNNKQSEKDNGIAIKETPEFAYALGHIECWLDSYSKSAGLSPESFTAELGKVLSSKARG